jgi:hypothetical protein
MVSPCLPRRKLLSPAERLALVKRPRRAVRRPAAHRAGASRRTGLSLLRQPPLGVFEQAAARRGSEDRGEGMGERSRSCRGPQATTETRVVGAMVNTQSLLGRLWADSCPSAIAAQRQECANTGHCLRARRISQIDPERPFAVGPIKRGVHPIADVHGTRPLFRCCFRESRSQSEPGPSSSELRVSGRQVGRTPLNLINLAGT